MTTNLLAAATTATMLVGSSLFGSVSGPAQAAPVDDPGPSTVEIPMVYREIYPKGQTWMDLLNADPELMTLAKCESQLRVDAINHGDSEITGFPSRGLLMFQPGTFTGYIRQYGIFPEAEDAELMNLIEDPYVHIYLARRMIDDGEIYHWKNCAIKHGLWDKYY